MIVTIDGPAGAGKSTVAKLLAEKLGFDFLVPIIIIFTRKISLHYSFSLEFIKIIILQEMKLA